MLMIMYIVQVISVGLNWIADKDKWSGLGSKSTSETFLIAVFSTFGGQESWVLGTEEEILCQMMLMESHFQKTVNL